jgi:uncharacterized protein DUF3489
MRRIWGQSNEKISSFSPRIDWLSQPNGALLWWLGAAMARFGDLPCRVLARAGLRWCGGSRRANLEDPMTERKTKPKAATRPIARKTAKPAFPYRSMPASSKSPARSATKHDRVIAMLRASAGATIASLVIATKWQQHSVRGFLAGVVRKKLGLNLVSEKTDKGRVYRIRAGKAPPTAAGRANQTA